MRLVRMFVGFVAAMSVVSISLAGAPSGWYLNQTIKYVYGGTVGNRAAVAVTGSITSGTCLNTGEFTIDENSAHGWVMWSIIILAYSKSLPINIYTDGSCGTNGLNATDVQLGTS
jgi:hypothetical protein